MSSPVEIIAREIYEDCVDEDTANERALAIRSALERKGYRVLTMNDIREWSMSRTATLPIPAAPTYGSSPEKQDEKL